MLITCDNRHYHKQLFLFTGSIVHQHNGSAGPSRMPAKAEWLLRLPEILAALRVLDIPVVDRAAMQRLFGFRRRRAIQFMHELDGYQAGHSFLVAGLLLT